MLTVKEWRKAKGLSIAKMADLLEVSPVTYASWEDTPTRMPVGKAIIFLNELGIQSQDVKDFLPLGSTNCSDGATE